MDSCMETISRTENYIADHASYDLRENALKTYEQSRTELEALEEKIVAGRTRGERLKEFIKRLKFAGGRIEQFDRELWSSLIDYAEVDVKGKIKFHFKDGSEV